MDLNLSEPSTTYRRLTLLDLILLVLASSLGISGWLFQSQVWSQKGENSLVPSNPNGWIALGSTLVMPFAWLVVLKGVRLPVRERLQPGYVACFAALFASFVNVLDLLAVASAMSQTNLHGYSLPAIVAYSFVKSSWNPTTFVSAVGVGWVVMAWSSSWKRSTATIEVLGRWVGIWFFVGFGVEWAFEFINWTRSYGFPKVFP